MALITETNTAVATVPTHVILGYSEMCMPRVSALLKRLCGSHEPVSILPVEANKNTPLKDYLDQPVEAKPLGWLKVEVSSDGRTPKYSKDLLAYAENALLVNATNNCLKILKHRNEDIPLPPMPALAGLPVFISHGYVPYGQ
jgi:hypothetical protein